MGFVGHPWKAREVPEAEAATAPHSRGGGGLATPLLSAACERRVGMETVRCPDDCV